MSTTLATKAALLLRLQGNTNLKNNLAPHPKNKCVPAIFEGSFNTITPVYPCITFRLPDVRPDGRFRPTAAEGGGVSPIQNLIIEMEIFDDRPDSSVRIEQIAESVYLEMDGQPLILDNTATGRGFHCANEYRSNPLWDPKNKNHFVLMRFRLNIHSL